jgi:hypothetical protein
MVQRKRIRQIHRCFIEASSAIAVVPTGAPDHDELDPEEGIPLPGSATYMLSEKGSFGKPGLEDWLEERQSTMRAWPLMDFSTFLSFCRQAGKICLKSRRPEALANAAVLTELMDIAIRLHRHMERLGTLGYAEGMFKVRIFMHLQYATMYRVLHTGPLAMQVFNDATSFFMSKVTSTQISASSSSTSRVPPAKAPSHSAGRSKAPRAASSATPPRCGCYLCPATDHYCNDAAFHPLNQAKKYAAVSQETRKKIIARVDASPLTATAKEDEKVVIRAFWERRCAP